MNLCTYENSFGKVVSVTGMEITIDVEKNLKNENLEQKIIINNNLTKLYVGTVGDIFAIGGPSIHDPIHFAIFEAVKLVSESEKVTETRAIVTAKVIGYQNPKISNKLSFKRGIGQYPRFNSKCFLLTSDEKQQLFELNDSGTLIGKSSGIQEEDIFIHTNKFLSKHSVILGSTGSGKSYTVASIIQKILNGHPFSHLIFFDLHNEYTSAFYNHKVNKIDLSNFLVPYWMLNFEEFQSIFLGDIDLTSNNSEIRILKQQITELKANHYEEYHKEIGKINKMNINSPIFFSFELLLDRLNHLNKQTIWKSDGSEAIDSETGLFLSNSGSSKVDRVDTGQKDQVLQGGCFNKLSQIIDKLFSLLNDKRYSFLFPNSIQNSLHLKDYLDSLLSINSNESQLSILDLSKIPSEVTPIIIGILARLCFEYKLWDPDPKLLPLYLIFEEAHNYMPKETSSTTKLPKKYISRIAKEGRKYGITQLIISQRPSDLSPSIISQCSNFIVLRVTNPEDQSFIQHVLPDHMSSLSSMIPFFENGEALIAGECVVIPTKLIIDPPNPIPNSTDIEFTAAWKNSLENYSSLNTLKYWWDVKDV